MTAAERTSITAFLASQKLAVISTCSKANHHPEAALIAFAEDQQLQLYFQTKRGSRKYKNLKLNPRVALVIGLNESPAVTVQIEGQASILSEAIDLNAFRTLFLEKNSPTTPSYLKRPDTEYFKVVPTWIGYSDYSQAIPHVFEITSF